MRNALTDAKWRVIEPVLPSQPGGVRRVDDRPVLSGIFRVLRSGAPCGIFPSATGLTPPATTGSCGGVAPAYGMCILIAISHRDAAQVQMIESTIVQASTPPASAWGNR